ncbi:MAG: CHAP domain-containing protein [Acetobacteraceae bacterium]|nr:CHAP domain-containing protein [Acetobacteraceae bacterium]
MPAVGTVPPKNFAVGRFLATVDGNTGPGNSSNSHSYWGVFDGFTVKGKKYEPQAGDLFYLPHSSDHVGIVEEVLGDGRVVTLNGNSGPAKGEGFDPRFEASAKIGSGFVYRKTRNLRDGKAMHAGACWIQVPD